MKLQYCTQSFVLLLSCINSSVICNSAGQNAPINSNSVYARSLAYTYARSNQTNPSPSNLTDEQLLAKFDMVPGGVTALIPFLENVESPGQFEPMIRAVQNRNIIIVPAIGNIAAKNNISDKMYQNMAAAYSNYTKYIRLDNLQGYYNKSGPGPIQFMIDYCRNLSFEHIMLNPWPIDQENLAVHFNGSEVDAAYQQIKLHFNRVTLEIYNNSQNWKPDFININRVLENQDTTSILVNYEDRPQEQALASLRPQPNASEIAMNITINAIKQSKDILYWTPPFSNDYNPVNLTTYGFIAQQLGELSGYSEM